MGRHELTDAEYELIAPELPTNDGKVGHPWNEHRPIINGILWRLMAGAGWRDIPERYELGMRNRHSIILGCSNSPSSGASSGP